MQPCVAPFFFADEGVVFAIWAGVFSVRIREEKGGGRRGKGKAR
jgi:hypothetical protein